MSATCRTRWAAERTQCYSVSDIETKPLRHRRGEARRLRKRTRYEA